MFRFELRCFQYAGLLVCALLLASTPDFAQQIRRSVDPPKSIVSLAPAPKPQGAILARLSGDASFEYTPANYHVFAAASVDTDAGVEVLTLNFAAETRLTHIESKNRDFVIEAGGTCHEGSSYTRGGACSLLVRFNPQGPGHRLGSINISHSAEATPMFLGLVGNGYSPVVSFTPSVITTVPGTYPSGAGLISGATALAVDGGDIVYVADTGNTYIREIDSSGTITSVQPAFSNPPVSIAVDSFGYIYNLNSSATPWYFSYINPYGGQSAFGYTYAAGTCTASTPCAFSTVGMGSPAHLGIDAYGDLFFQERSKGAAEMPVAAISGGSGAFKLWYLSDIYAYLPGPGVESFAVDAGGNLYTSYIYNTDCSILEEPLYTAESTPTFTRVAGASACGFSGDGGQARGARISTTLGQFAFDIAGNLYFADTGNQRVRRIDATTGIISTVAGNGTAGYTGDGGAATSATLNNPTGIAVDSQGQVYIISSATTNQVLRQITTNGTLSFSAQVQGTTSAAKVITVSNTGNSELVLSNYAFTGTNPGDFSIDPTTTSCILTSGATLGAGLSCKIGVTFKPGGTGARSASLVFNDNTVTNQNTILLSGVGATTPTFSFSPTSLSFPSEPVGTVSASQQVTLANTGASTATISSIAITGANASSFFFANNCGSTLAAGANCIIHGHFTPTTTGALTAAITVTDNAVGSPQSIPLSGTGTAPAIAKTGVKIESSANPTKTCNAVTFTANVTTDTGVLPTGEVEFMNGANRLGAAKITNAQAQFSILPLRAETMMLTANYPGDSAHEAAASTVYKLVVNAGSKLNTTCGGLPVRPVRLHR